MNRQRGEPSLLKQGVLSVSWNYPLQEKHRNSQLVIIRYFFMS